MAVAPKFKKELAPEGDNDGVVTMIADVGTQKAKNPKHNDTRKIILGIELSKMSNKDFQKIIYQTLTFSSSNKGNMGKVVKNSLNNKKLDMEGYDMRDFLGTCVKVNIEHNDEYDNIGIEGDIAEGFSPGKKMKSFGEHCAYFIDEHDETEFEALPEWVQKKIIDSPEYDEVAMSKSKKKPAGKTAPSRNVKATRGR